MSNFVDSVNILLPASTTGRILVAFVSMCVELGGYTYVYGIANSF